MQLRDRNGWSHLEQPKLALQITVQKEKKVFGCLNKDCTYTASIALENIVNIQQIVDCKQIAVTITELQENTEALKTKMSELRLYCDLLLQQVKKIKENDELRDTAEVRIKFG